MVHVFEHLKFIILKNGSDPIEAKISNLLKSNGCSNLQLTSPSTFKSQLCSISEQRHNVHFVITDSTPSNGILLPCFKMAIPVVNIDWILECAKRQKIVRIEPFQYFSNVLKNSKFYISRYSFNEQEYKFLRNLVLLLGGDVTYILSKRAVTHLLLKHNDTDENDPIKQLLPILNHHHHHDHDHDRPSDKVEEEINVVDEVWLFNKYFHSEYSNTIIRRSVRDTDDCGSSFHKLVFDEYQFLIDLQMDTTLIDHLSNMIKSYGGTISLHEGNISTGIPIANSSNKKSIYLGEFHGNALFNSVHTHHDIIKVNLNWVFQCILQQDTDILMDQDGHNRMIYEIPNGTQRNLCSGMKISYTQFFGLQRFEIIDKIEMLGGVATPNLGLDTDLLIVGVAGGSKYNFALKNSIQMVTPEWLDKTFAYCSKQPFDRYVPACGDDGNMFSHIDEIVDNDTVITSSPCMMIAEEQLDTKGHATLDTTKLHSEPTKTKTKTDNNNNDNNDNKRLNKTRIVKRTNKRQKVEDKARKILLENGIENIESLYYNIRCVTTQCLDGLTSLDKEMLKLIGIEIFDEINDSNMKLLNGVIAPRRLRTFKFLLSLSFEPLEYALTPQFITDVLDIIKNGHNISETLSNIDLKKYWIQEMDMDILQRTQLPDKVFVRGTITNVNMSCNMQGGTETLKKILESHGIKNVNVLKKKFSVEDIVENVNYSGTHDGIPQYILITDQQSQVKQFKRVLLKNDKKNTKGIFIVEWNWCVQCIFGLDVSYSKYKSAILYNE